MRGKVAKRLRKDALAFVNGTGLHFRAALQELKEQWHKLSHKQKGRLK